MSLLTEKLFENTQTVQYSVINAPTIVIDGDPHSFMKEMRSVFFIHSYLCSPCSNHFISFRTDGFPLCQVYELLTCDTQLSFCITH